MGRPGICETRPLQRELIDMPLTGPWPEDPMRSHGRGLSIGVGDLARICLQGARAYDNAAISAHLGRRRNGRQITGGRAKAWK